MSARRNELTAKYIAGFIGLSTVYSALSLRKKQLQLLSEEGRKPVVLPKNLPGHFHRALRNQSAPTEVQEVGQLTGLWLAFYNEASVLQLTGSGGSLVAEHLTGNRLIPAGSPAFVVHQDAKTLNGHCMASLLPGGLLSMQLPCQVTAHGETLLTVDCQIASWLPWLRVPLQVKISQAFGYVFVASAAKCFHRGSGLGPRPTAAQGRLCGSILLLKE